MAKQEGKSGTGPHPQAGAPAANPQGTNGGTDAESGSVGTMPPGMTGEPPREPDHGVTGPSPQPLPQGGRANVHPAERQPGPQHEPLKTAEHGRPVSFVDPRIEHSVPPDLHAEFEKRAAHLASQAEEEKVKVAEALKRTDSGNVFRITGTMRILGVKDNPEPGAIVADVDFPPGTDFVRLMTLGALEPAVPLRSDPRSGAMPQHALEEIESMQRQVERLDKENERLTAENERLRKENEQLRAKA